MESTYRAYRELLGLLRENDYFIRGYHDYEDTARCVILRHDIDNSLPQAVRLAELEAEEGVRSTWFVLLRTGFYNAFSKAGKETLDRICALGHEIGLHFDEVTYAPALTRNYNPIHFDTSEARQSRYKQPIAYGKPGEVYSRRDQDSHARVQLYL